MSDLAKLVGGRIRAARKARGWSQEEMAARAGIHFTYVGAVERGEKNVTVKSLQRLSRTLGVAMGDLLDPAARAAEPRVPYASAPCEFETLLQRRSPRVKRRALELLRLALRLG